MNPFFRSKAHGLVFSAPSRQSLKKRFHGLAGQDNSGQKRYPYPSVVASQAQQIRITALRSAIIDIRFLRDEGQGLQINLRTLLWFQFSGLRQSGRENRETVLPCQGIRLSINPLGLIAEIWSGPARDIPIYSERL
jgi:hypothetical protein